MENSPTALIARADLMANGSIKSVQDLKGMRLVLLVAQAVEVSIY